VKELIESLRDASINVKSCLLPLGETLLQILIRFRSVEFCAGHILTKSAIFKMSIVNSDPKVLSIFSYIFLLAQ
jgi:hypothetical protein